MNVWTCVHDRHVDRRRCLCSGSQCTTSLVFIWRRITSSKERYQILTFTFATLRHSFMFLATSKARCPLGLNTKDKHQGVPIIKQEWNMFVYSCITCIAVKLVQTQRKWCLSYAVTVTLQVCVVFVEIKKTLSGNWFYLRWRRADLCWPRANCIRYDALIHSGCNHCSQPLSAMNHAESNDNKLLFVSLWHASNDCLSTHSRLLQFTQPLLCVRWCVLAVVKGLHETTNKLFIFEQMLSKDRLRACT